MPPTARASVREGLGAAGLHLVLALGVFSPAFLSGGMLVPADLLRTIYPWGAYLPQTPSHNPALLDVVQQFYPWFLFLRDELLAGRVPLWNPALSLGLPHAANPLTASFFPLSLLALGGPAGWNATLLLRVVLAGTGAYAFLRQDRTRLASAVGSTAFAYSFPFFPYLPMSIANVTALLPWLALAACRTASRGTALSAALYGAALGLMHLGGQPEATAFYAPAAVAIALVRPGGGAGRRPRTAALLFLGGVAGTLAAAVQLLPFLDYLLRSRALLDPEPRTTVLPARGLLSWVVPGFFDDPVRKLSWGGMPPLVEYAGFAGAFALALAFAALVLGRRRTVAAPALLVLLGVSLPFGFPPLAVLNLLPVVERARTQRILPLAAFGVAWLAAIGFDRLSALRRARRARGRARALAAMAFPLAAIAVALLWLGGRGASEVVRATAGEGLVRAALLVALGTALVTVRLTPRLRVAGLCAVAVVDCCGPVVSFHGAEPPSTAFFQTGLTRFLRDREGSFRVLPLGYVMPPNTNVPSGIASILSYDAVDDLDQVRFLRHLGGYHGKSHFSTVLPEQIRNPRVLELAAVRYLLVDPQSPRLDTDGYRTSSGLSLKRVYDQADGTVYELETSRPLVWGAGAAVLDPGLVRFEGRLQAADDAVLRTPFVDVAGVPAGDGAPVIASPARRAGGEIAVDVAAEGAGWLFVAEGGFPSWRATVDGRDAPVYRASGPFQAIPVPRGAHRVVLRYAPASFRAGLAVSVAGVLALAAMAVAGNRRIRPS